MKSHRRISRALISFLAVILVMGLVTWAYNIGRRSAAAEKSAAEAKREVRAAPPIDPGVPAAGNAKVASALGFAATTSPVASTTLPQTSGALVTETPSGPAPAAASSQPVVASLLAATVNVPTTRPSTPSTPVASRGLATAPSAGGATAQLASAVTLSATPLADAKAKLDAGNLLTARRILSAALHESGLSESDTAAAKQMLSAINAKVVFSTQRFPDDELGGTMTVPTGGVLAKIAASHEVTPELLMRINGISDARKLRAQQPLKLIQGPFHAVVYKGKFTLEVWLGSPSDKSSMFITSFPVGLGRDDSTPSGVWAIGAKLKNPAYYSPRGEGVIAADDPKNPLGEYWIALTGTDGQAVGKTSYGIHGTIDPTSIGKQESMGCIRMKNEDVAQVFEMLVEGKSTVLVKD